MRILLVTGEMNSGGAETHVYELARSLCNAGHTVTLASVGGRLARELGTMGVKNIRLPLNSKSPFSLAFSVKKVKRLIKSNNYQIVHAHTRIAAMVCHLACKNKKCAFVTTVHAHFKSNFLFDKLSRWGCASIAVSEDLKDYLLTHSDRVIARNIRVIPNGIDTDKFFPLKNSSVGKRVVFASRLDADCSEVAYLLCSVAKRLLCRFEDVQIVICGGGSEYLTLKRLAQEVNAELGRKVISTLGNVENMAEILQGASVFVGVSRAALEAMCCALPVIIGGNEGYIGALDENNLAATHVAEQLGEPIERVYKTLVLRGDRTGHFVCIVQGDREVDLKAAAKVSGNKSAEMIPMKELLPTTGYIRGGCTAIGMKKRFPTFIDTTATAFDYIYVSAGVRGLQLKLNPTDLIAFVGAQVADIESVAELE